MAVALPARHRCRSNEAIVKGLHAIGLEALIITAAAVTGSTLAAWGLWYLLHTRYQKKEAKP